MATTDFASVAADRHSQPLTEKAPLTDVESLIGLRMSGFELPGMTRPRGSSAASEDSMGTVREQELGSMYDYLAKVILLGPSGTGK